MDFIIPVYQQAVTSKGIEIGQDVWLGAHVGMKDGVKIASHAVIGMNSMVTKNVAEREIVAGNPALYSLS
jgi:acetyltransferase-like isoleucine patch superfamily enzyme